MTLTYMTAGESHGPALVGILSGMPYGIHVDCNDFSELLRRRRCGYGRGSRQKIEKDRIRVLSGIYKNMTTGAPIAIIIENTEYKDNGSIIPAPMPEINIPLPGHADLPGAVKYGIKDCRFIRERASARETAMRTALSVPPRAYLRTKSVSLMAFIESIGGIEASADYSTSLCELIEAAKHNGEDFITPDPLVIQQWKQLTDKAAEEGHGLGGVVSVVIDGLPVGLGSCAQPDERLDSHLAALMMSIPSVKGVEIGMASELSHSTKAMGDSIIYENGKRVFETNYSGGIDGGLSNGAPVILRLHIKPLPGSQHLPSINLMTGEKAMPEPYRSDIHAFSAAAIAAESVAAIEIASQMLDCAK